MGFGQGLSGLNAASQQLDVIGNNIANSGTVGFKAASASFSDVYASSKVGLGVQVAAITQRFSIGNIRDTGGEFDIAVDGANGLFRMQDPNGSISYTRNGQFLADINNFIINAQGQRLTGYDVSGTNLVPIKVPSGNIAPQATAISTMVTNLDANEPAINSDSQDILGKVMLTPDPGPGAAAAFYYTTDGAGTTTWVNADGTALTPAPTGTYLSENGEPLDFANPTTFAGVFANKGDGEVAFVADGIPGKPFDPARTETYTHSQSFPVYDSLGNSHELKLYFVKREGENGASQWDVNYRLDGKALEAPNAPVDGATRMTFDGDGRLTSEPIVALTIANPGGTASPAAAMNFNVNFTGTTQFAGDFTPDFIQDGYATGEYASMSIGKDGSIVANYTNGKTQNLGYVALADFNNLQGLQPIGGNAWIETGTSGPPIVGRPGSNGLAALKGQSVEESNVDMSAELVNMIIAQRTYQANAQTIKTQDQVLQTLITMR